MAENNEYQVTTIPNQLVSSKEKMTKTWQENTIKYFIGSNSYSNREKRKSIEEMDNNWNIINSSVTDDELSDSFDPLGIRKESEFQAAPIKLQFYNVVNNPINTVVGEELKRKSDIRAIVLNTNIINQKDKAFREKLYGFLNELSKQPATDPTRLKDELAAMDKWRKHDLQTAHEVMVNQIIQLINNDPRIDLKTKFNKCLKDLLVNAEAIVRAGNIGKEPMLYNVDGRYFTVLGLGKSNRIEDGWAWIEEDYMNPYKIIEEFGNKLTKKQTAKLLTAFEESLNVLPQYNTNAITVIDGTNISSDTELLGGDFINLGRSNDYIDKEGNILVTRIYWLSPRKIGELKYYDEFGDVQTMFVDEYYVPNIEKGEEVQWYYINELWQGIQISNDTIIEVKPCDVQMRSIINPSIVRPPYIGIIKSEGSGKVRSLLDMIIPYQKDFTIWMNKLKLLWVQNMGKVANIDISMIPEKMSIDEWWMWISTFKVNFQNKFNESDKGYIAGNMQQSGKDIDLDITNEIFAAIQQLDWLQAQIDKISGISRQRQGDISPREGLGVSQQSIVQSSHQTEPDFYLLDMLKIRTYEVMIEYIKFLWKDEKGKRQYMLDDVSNYIIDIDGALLMEGEYGVQITNSGRLYEMEQMLMQLSHAAMQTGTATLTDIAKMKMSTSPSEMLNELSASEDRRLKQLQESQKMQLESQERQQQLLMEIESKKQQFELEKINLEWSYRLQEVQLKSDLENRQRIEDTNANWIKDEVENDMNIRDNESKKEELDKTLKFKEKELSIKEKIEMAKLKVQKETANKRPSTK